MSSLIRYATITDIPELLPLLEQLGYPTSKSVLTDRFERLCKNQDTVSS